MNIKCNVCGCEFPPIAERHYIARDDGKVGIVAAFQANPEEKIYDAFDCPNCGCQMIVQERKRSYIPCNELDDDCDLEGVFDDE